MTSSSVGRFAFAALIFLAQPTQASEDATCIRTAFAKHLNGVAVTAISSRPGSVIVALEEPGLPGFVMLGLAVSGTQFVTFTTTRGRDGGSAVPEATLAVLNPALTDMGNDKDVIACAALARPSIPKADDVYKEIDALFRKLKPESPSAPSTSTNFPAGPLVGVAAILLFAVFGGLAVVEMRRRKKAADQPSVESPEV